MAGGGGGAAVGGQGGAPDGCVRITVSPQLLGDEWFRALEAFPGWVWRTPSGLHVAWPGYRSYPEGTQAAFLSQTRTWLIVSSFEPATGELLAQREYDLFPADLSYSETWIYAVAGHEDDSFVAVVEYEPQYETEGSPILLVRGQLAQPQLLGSVELSTPEVAGVSRPSHVAWDGEAYAVQMSDGQSLLVSRVGLDGSLLLPPTAYGVGMGVGYGEQGYHSSTNAESGATFVYAAQSGRWVTGHQRDGSALPLAATDGGLTVLPPEMSEAGAAYPAVAADELGGAWLVWQQFQSSGADNLHTGVAARIDAEGQLDPVLAFAPTAADAWPPENSCVIARSDRDAWIASNTRQEILVWEVTDGLLGEPRTLVVGPGGGTNLAVGMLTAFDWRGETWFGFSHTSSGSLHVVKADPGCVYAAP